MNRWRLPKQSFSTLLYLALLALVVAYAYAWSLRQFHRADQWWFLLDTIDGGGVWDTFRRCYSWDRMTGIALANPVLYRPALFFLLSLQKGLFGAHVWGYQAVSIALHLVVCIQLYFILRLLALRTPPDLPAGRPLRILAHLVPLFIAGNLNLAESVLWAHLNGYLAFYALALAAIMSVLKACEETIARSARIRWLALGFLAMATGSFFMEYGQYFAVVLAVAVGMFLPRTVSRRFRYTAVAGFIAALALYQGANQIDKRLHNPFIPATEQQARPLWKEPFEPAAWKNTFYFLKFTSLSPLFPSVAEGKLLDHGRLMMSQVGIGKLLRGGLIGYLGLVAVGAAGAFALVGAWSCARRISPATVAATIAAGSFALYGAGIVLIRMRTIGPDYLESYYTYWPFVSGTVCAFACWCGAAQTLRSPKAARFFALSLALLAGWMMAQLPVSLVKLRRLEKTMAERFQVDNAFVNAVNGVIYAHRGEPGFGLAFDTAHSEGVTVPLMHGVPAGTILFRQYENPEAPSHIIVQHMGTIQALTPEQYKSAYPDAVCPPFPRLVRPGALDNIFAYKDNYYVLPRFEGVFDPARKDYQGLVRAATLDEALAVK